MTVTYVLYHRDEVFIATAGALDSKVLGHKKSSNPSYSSWFT
ncbi:hypothetical protein SOVF_096180 isoform A [Spinacia oleracea]|nr:hypothetical protein SOVF_096180 isoform A [Spinacia oleracea]